MTMTMTIPNTTIVDHKQIYLLSIMRPSTSSRNTWFQCKTDMDMELRAHMKLRKGCLQIAVQVKVTRCIKVSAGKGLQITWIEMRAFALIFVCSHPTQIRIIRSEIKPIQHVYMTGCCYKSNHLKWSMNQCKMSMMINLFWLLCIPGSQLHVFVDTFSVFEPIHNNEFVERLVALQSSLSNIPDTDWTEADVLHEAVLRLKSVFGLQNGILSARMVTPLPTTISIDRSEPLALRRPSAFIVLVFFSVKQTMYLSAEFGSRECRKHLTFLSLCRNANLDMAFNSYLVNFLIFEGDGSEDVVSAQRARITRSSQLCYGTVHLLEIIWIFNLEQTSISVHINRQFSIFLSFRHRDKYFESVDARISAMQCSPQALQLEANLPCMIVSTFANGSIKLEVRS